MIPFHASSVYAGIILWLVSGFKKKKCGIFVRKKGCVCVCMYVPGTQMTLVLIGKDLVSKGSTTKIEDISRFQVCIYHIYIHLEHRQVACSPLEGPERKRGVRWATVKA